MPSKERFLAAEDSSSTARRPRSQAGLVVAQLGIVSYWLGLVLAVLSLLVSMGFIAVSTEALAYRLMSVVFLGIFPAITAWAAGWALLRILRIASEICDLIAEPLYRVYLILTETALSVRDCFVWLTKDVMPQYVRTIAIFLRACHCGMRRFIAGTAFYFKIILRISMIAYRYFLMVITFPIRLVAQVLIATIPQQV
jgi:hypothetical protein